MSNLRIISLVIGIIGLILAFRIYRGSRWKRSSFMAMSGISFCFILISVNPDIVNIFTGMLSLNQEHRGRLIALLIFSNVFLWFLYIYGNSQKEDIRHQFDLLIRRLSYESADLLDSSLDQADILIIMPAYNEAQSLQDLLPKVPDSIMGKTVKVLVIDDGSSDNTSEVIDKSRYFYVRNKINRGQGAASRLGYDVMMYHNISYGVTMDSDGQHCPEDLEKMLEKVINNSCDLVIGSRVLGQGFENSYLRKLGIGFFGKVLYIITGVRLTDCSSGFKAFNAGEMKKLNLTQDQFQSAEVIIEAAKKGLKIKEVPITIKARQLGHSKKGGDWSYGINFTTAILKTWFRR